jgi:Fe-S cluster assembly scaffold protein SufB
MKHFATILIAVCVAGCGAEHHEANDHEDHEAETRSLYQKDRGLLLPDDLRDSLGVTFVEIGELPVTVPKSAVVEGVQEDFVYVQNGEHLTRTPVVTGARRGDEVQIAEGVLAGDQVVAVGARDLWMIELLAIRGGSPCCPVPKKDKR